MNTLNCSEDIFEDRQDDCGQWGQQICQRHLLCKQQQIKLPSISDIAVKLSQMCFISLWIFFQQMQFLVRFKLFIIH